MTTNTRFVPAALVLALLALATIVAEPAGAGAWQEGVRHAIGFVAFALAVRAASPSCRWPVALALALAAAAAMALLASVAQGATDVWRDAGADVAGFGLGWLLSHAVPGIEPPDGALPLDTARLGRPASDQPPA